MEVDPRVVTEDDVRYIATCLGREPRGLACIAVRGAHGEPVVIKNHPLIAIGGRYQPFPTLYWLIDPTLTQRIAEIERKGGVHQIEALLEANEDWMLAHRTDNVAYARLRAELLLEEDKAIAEENGFLETLTREGIGGVANYASVKCLHAQFAFHLVRLECGTMVGNLMERQYGIEPV